MHNNPEERLNSCYWLATAGLKASWLPFKFDQFLGALSCIAVYRSNPEYSLADPQYTDRHTTVEIIEWIIERDLQKITSIIFQHVELLANEGGSSGTQTKSVTTRLGRVNEAEIAPSTLARVEEAVRYSEIHQALGNQVRNQFDF